MTSRSDMSLLPTTGGHPFVRRCRDLLYWHDGDTVYVVACDSNAGIGQRPTDALNKVPTEVGYSAAKVPLMEVVASGATPFMLADALGGPMDDYGRQLLAGIEAAISEVDAPVALTGSDETNIPTRQTAVGVTVVGRAHITELRLGRAEIGDLILAVGRPSDGMVRPYLEGQTHIAGLYDLQTVGRLPFVHELLPVGSRGVAYEARQLAGYQGAQVAFLPEPDVDLTGSAGACTCFLVAVPAEHADAVREVCRPPVAEVGRIVAADEP